MSGDLKPANDETSNEKALVTVALAKVKLAAAVVVNAVKAITLLCGASTKYVTGRIEDADDEKRAASLARIKVIDAMGTELAYQVTVEAGQAKAAFHQAANKILNQQDNINRIAGIALEDLRAEDSSSDSTSAQEEIDVDWLNQFEDIAKLMNSDRMRIMFGKILAGEIRKPNSFSVRTLQVLAQMDSKTALLFKRYCSMAMSFDFGGVGDARVVCPTGDAGSNGLRSYGLSFDALNILQEHGLIIADFNSYIAYNWAIVANSAVANVLRFQGNYYVFRQDEPWPNNQELRVHGVAATTAGRELLKVVDFEEVPEYEAALKKHFEDRKLSFSEVSKAEAPWAQNS